MISAVTRLFAKPRTPVVIGPRQTWIAEQAIVLACAWATFFALYTEGFEAEWYRLEQVMSFTEDPPFQQRVLFALVARGIQRLTDWRAPRCFLLSQIPVILLLFEMSLVWSRLFVTRRLAMIGPLLLCVMLAPTFHYWTFYDLATGLFFTVGLYAAFTQRWGLFLLVTAVATFNHEVILLLIPTAGFVWWGTMPRGEWTWRVAVPLAVHVAGRAVLFAALPADTAWEGGRIAFNLQLPFRNPGALAMSLFTLLPWWGLSVLGWWRAPVALRRAAMLLPMQWAVVFVVGQFNEPRLFIPFMPLAAAFVLGWIGASRQAEAGSA